MRQKIRGASVIWGLAAPLLFYMVISDITLYACQALSGEMTERNVLPANAMGAALAAIPLWQRYCEARREYRMQQRNPQAAEYRAVWADVIPVILMAVGACIFFNNLLLFLDISSEGFDRAEKILAAPPLPVQILCTGFVIPFTEELVFRGLAYTRLRKEMPVWEAMLVSAIYFGLFHGNLVQGIYAAMLGCLLAVLYEWYDSLAASWLFHAAANVTAVLMSAFGIQGFLLEQQPRMAAATVFGGVLVLVSAYKIKKGKKTS